MLMFSKRRTLILDVYGKKIFIILTVLILASLMASCAESTTSSGPIEYLRSGGFVGLNDHLIINVGRKATLTRKTGNYEFVLDQKAFDQLEQQLKQVEFSKFEEKYLPVDTCCDLIEYTITYEGHTVQTMDTAVPATLQPILNLLNEIIETEGKP